MEKKLYVAPRMEVTAIQSMSILAASVNPKDAQPKDDVRFQSRRHETGQQGFSWKE